MHENSLAAWADLDVSCRKGMILDVIGDRPMTDREIKEELFLQDMNCVRPRITELVKDGLLLEVGSKKDKVTGRTVRVCRRTLC